MILILTLASFTAVYAQGESKCFQNQSLQGENSVVFEVKGNEVSGTFSVDDGDIDSVKTYEFTGVRSGSVLRIKFDGVVFPDVAPSEMKSLNWTLLKIGDREILRIKFYGKNYKTNKYADYFADFESCKPSYATLLKTAKVVQFAKGKTSANVPLFFKDTNDRKIFSVNIRKGQILKIDAVGCKVSVHLPSGKHYEFVEWENENGTEKSFTSTTIDELEIKPIPQTGNYLIVLQKMAEEARPSTVTFKITN